MPDLEIRPLAAADSIQELTDLVHRAYARLGAMGLNYTAVDQPAEVTAKRCAKGECFVALLDGRVVGTVTLTPPNSNSSCRWYTKPEVTVANQLAVDPPCQGTGIGSALMTHVEARAAELGYLELAIDTAEPATHLVDFYRCRGHALVDRVHWDGKTYDSLIMSKKLNGKDCKHAAHAISP